MNSAQTLNYPGRMLKVEVPTMRQTLPLHTLALTALLCIGLTPCC